MAAKSIVVTGASTGIGRACVDELVRGGAHVWATVRGDADEEALRRDHGERVSVLRMDLTDLESVRAAGERVCAAGRLNGLVNNAGVAVASPLEHVPIDAFAHQIHVNLIAQLAVAQAMLPALRDAAEHNERSRIVLVGSIAGRVAKPMLGPYHASKFGLVGLAETLRAELAPWGIRVALVEPGAIVSSIWSRAEEAGDRLLDRMPEAGRQRYAAQIDAARASARRSARRGLPAARAAAVIVKALTSGNPRPRYLVGTDARIGSVVARLPYRLRDRLIAGSR
ncbi:SDR family NAD(P)-dependent oxidoreductase [Rugosimonospora africana]|uniref:Short-chain dehydrogenase n=1 Tax=Rugosimonospora africana TaxID=556532 RepID=A0A8J3VQJ0_9ACTN|nr:SDR family NAD(P)-dependent oxidoreductase [Rugosimonospora africana]GIH14531.1 short-chain dehydrogenase [Rugosimonospora africana]